MLLNRQFLRHHNLLFNLSVVVRVIKQESAIPDVSLFDQQRELNPLTSWRIPFTQSTGCTLLSIQKMATSSHTWYQLSVKELLRQFPPLRPGMSWASHCEIPGRPLDLAPLSQWVTGPWAHTCDPGETWAQIPLLPAVFHLTSQDPCLVEWRPSRLHLLRAPFTWPWTQREYALTFPWRTPAGFFFPSCKSLVVRVCRQKLLHKEEFNLNSARLPWTSLRVIDRVSRIIHPVRL